MSRFLMLPFAPTSGLAHLGACATVGRELRDRGHEVVFGYGGSVPELIAREGFRYEPVLEVPAEREWHPGGWFRSGSDVGRLVDSHVELIARLRPDAAVTSAGVASRLACEVTGVPEIHLMHYLPLTRHGQVPSVVWGNRLRDARHPRRVVRLLRGRSQRTSPPRESTDTLVEEARSALGLPPSGSGALRRCRDTIVALTTAPMLDPARDLPGHWRYVGPLTWSVPGTPVPTHQGRPLVYLTQGSTGSPDSLQWAVRELADEPVDVVASTGGLMDPAALEGLAQNVTATHLLSGQDCLRAADAAVVHGGHLTNVEALLAGTPVVVMPHRVDHFASAGRAERLGVGIGVWPKASRGGAVLTAVRRILSRPGYRRRAARVAESLGNDWNGARNTADLAVALIHSGERSSSPPASASLRWGSYI